MKSIIAGVLAFGAVVSAAPATSVQQCLSTKKVPVIAPKDPYYVNATIPFNLRLPYSPAVLVYPTTSQQVADAVKCAGQFGVKVQAKSGGHSYASYSSGGKNGSMVIDLEPMQDVKVTGEIAKVGGGVRLGNLADKIYTQGKRALSHGTCPGVGIGGHFTHGGYGHTSRNWGLALDHIVGADVVLPNGTLVYANETSSPEIYWAIRGAADSFGIITNFYLKTHAAPESLTYFSFQWADTFWKEPKKEEFTNTFLHFQAFSLNSSVVDNRISWGIYLDGVGAFSFSGTFFGTPEEFNSTIKPELLRSLPIAPPTQIVKSYGWYDYLVLMSDKTTIVEPTKSYPDHDTFYAKSITVPEKDGLTAAALNSFYDYVSGDVPADVTFFVIINLYGGPGSAINSKDTNFAAYNDRDSLFVFQNYGNGDMVAAQPFISGINDAIITAQPETSFGAYLNYVDPNYTPAEAHHLYYGDALYAKLLALKKTVDPKSVYWNPQAIGA